MAKIGLFISIVVIVCGCSKQSKTETPEQHMDRIRQEAQSALNQEITNAVPGIQSVFKSEIDNQSGPFNKWEGNAVVDYKNSVGGISRTNLFFKFVMGADHVQAYQDLESGMKISSNQ